MSNPKPDWLFVLVGVWLAGLSVWCQAESDTQRSQAERLISEYETSIHQVKIINTHSQSQSTIGTGFFIDDGSLFTTNYHVVSPVVLEPSQYSAELSLDGRAVTMEVLAIDVIHDLAILRVPQPGPPLTLSETPPQRGARLFSIGNPLNIGMTLVEGNYNGLVDDRFFDQIHFSGAINAGMSGGPTLNQQGRVVGINVASAGNQVGFLVPVNKLHNLLATVGKSEGESGEPADERPATASLKRDIGVQLQRASHTMIDRIMSQPWPRENLGDAVVIGQVHPAVDCWGSSNEDLEKRLTTVQKGCNSRDGIYISQSLRSGYLEYEFSYQKARDWPAASLYRHTSRLLSRYRPGNPAGKEDVDNYSCIDRTVKRESDGLKRQMVYCTRPYVRYPELFDTLYVAATLDKPDTVLVEHFTLSGVTRQDGERFLGRFIEQVAWR